MRDRVRRLVLEVLRELQVAPASLPEERRQAAGPTVLVLYDSGLFRQDEALDQVAKIARQAGKVSFFQSPRARSLMGRTDVKALTGTRCSLNEAASDAVFKVMGRADVVLAPTLSLKVAARVARLTSDCQGSELLMSAILGGKRVIAANDGFKGADVSLAPGLRAEIDRTLETIAGYGVTLCPTARLAASYEGLGLGARREEAGPAEPERPAALHLVSAADVSAAYQSKTSKVFVAAKGIVTPLAADVAKEYGVEIVRESA